MSKWNDGVNEYAKELKAIFDDNYGDDDLPMTEERLLNGASSWHEYSWGGSTLIYDADIAERLATPSEIKRRTLKDGLSSWANGQEQWLDVQARALHQAARKLLRNNKALTEGK